MPYIVENKSIDKTRLGIPEEFNFTSFFHDYGLTSKTIAFKKIDES